MQVRILIPILLSLLISPSGWAQRQIVDRVVAVVNDEAITQSELDIYLRPLYEELKAQYDGEELMRQLHDLQLKLLNQIIEDRLVYQESRTRGVMIEESEIDRMLEETKSRFPSEAEYQALISDTTRLGQIRENLRRQAAIKRLHDMEIRSQVVVSPQEIEDYYRNRQSEFAEEESLRVFSITVRKSEETVQKGVIDEAARAKIEGLRGQILRGENFEKLAREFSEDANAKEGGAVGWMKRGTMLPAIEEALFQMKTGGISPVLETALGYHVFKVEEKKISRIPPLEEVRNKIRVVLYQEEARKRFKEWMENLKKQAYISIR